MSSEMGESTWEAVLRGLVDVAMGRRPATRLIRNGRWVCVQSGEIIEGTDIALDGERIAYVGPDASHTIGDETDVLEAEGRFLVPGLLDGHMHVESGMLTVTEFARAVMRRGTTGMFIDPHEIANVLGMPGIRMMAQEAAVQPIHVWVQMPSCVPSHPGLETPGARIGVQDVAEAFTWPRMIGLGEMMNFPGVSAGDPQMLAEMAEARRAGKIIGGHYASPDLGLPFHAYVAGGAEDDHEGVRLEDAVVRVRQGMKAMLRLGSAWHDVAAQLPAITKLGLDPRHFMLVTDDSHSGTLVDEGHMDRVVRFAIRQGASPMTALQMATLNTAEHFGVAREVGQIAPGRFGDVLVTPDLSSLQADLVLAKGRVVAEAGELRIERPSFDYPAAVRQSVRIPRELRREDFRVASPHAGEVTVHVIGVIENQAPTRHLRLPLSAVDGHLPPDRTRDIAKIALIERHHNSGRIQLGFVQGFGLREPCAVASTVAHDSHHLLVVGTDEADMAQAANELRRLGGGQIVVSGGRILGLVELPIAGLMSDRPATEVARNANGVLQAMRQVGCTLNNANMTLSLLALVVIPQLRISDLGLVDVERFEIVPVVAG
jgi:adenine deaminase